MIVNFINTLDLKTPLFHPSRIYIYIYIYIYKGCIRALQYIECLSMVWETWVQSQVESYLRLKKWYLMLPCVTFSIIRYVSMVKWSNPGKGVALCQHLSVVAIEKRAFCSPTHFSTWFGGFYGISTFVGYLIPNPFLCK